MVLHLGVKSDPILYRYSFDWLFNLMAEEGVRHFQLGSFFELYHLPDRFFTKLRKKADGHGVMISSLFTSFRELGGWYYDDPDWCEVAYANYRRLIEVAAALGVERAGSSLGAVWRDRLDLKQQGTECYIEHMKGLTAYAFDKGLSWLTIEPMSCLAEMPTLPDEIRYVAESLQRYHDAHPNTVPVGYCFDVSHGFADEHEQVRFTPMELLEAALPQVVELHLKNTDAIYNSTFGFSDADRARGVVDVPSVLKFLQDHATRLPVQELVCYLEIPGPKLGRDYSDYKLEGQLRESLRYLAGLFGE